MYAPNPYRAYIPCSIIIETRPEKDMHKEINLSSSIASKLNSDIGHQTIQTQETKLFCMFISFVCFIWKRK